MNAPDLVKWILTILCTWIHHWNRGIKGLDFDDLDLGDIRIANPDQKRFVCTLSCETIDDFLLNSHGYIIGMGYFKEKEYLKRHAFYNRWRHNILMTVCICYLRM